MKRNPNTLSIVLTKAAVALMLICPTIASFAQTLSPRIYSTQGGSLTGGSLNLQYTVGEPENQTFIAGAYEFSFGFNQPEQNIRVDSITGGPFYTGDSVIIYFSATGIYGNSNLFIAQLSSSIGSFTSPLNLASVAGKNASKISAFLPFSILTGTQYAIRIVSSQPSFTSERSIPFEIHTLGQPSGINSEMACSDTSYVFTLNPISSSGGSRIEYARNKNFAPSITLSSPAMITDTVFVNGFDTLLFRSKDTLGHFSDIVTITLAVDSFPHASLSPLDTLLYIGDTISLQVNGGAFYNWPQFNTDSATIPVVFQGDTFNYWVDVTSANGCQRQIDGRVLSLVNATLTPNLTATNPDVGIPFGGGTSIDTMSISGCHDFLTSSVLVTPGSLSGDYRIVQIFPANVTPDVASLVDSVKLNTNRDSVMAVATAGTPVTYRFNPGSNNGPDTLTWFVSAGYDTIVGNFKLIVNLYTNCSTSLLSHQFITTSLYVAGSGDAQASASQMLPIINKPWLTASITTSPVTAGSRGIENIAICAYNNESYRGVIYGFAIQPLFSVDTIKLAGSVDSGYFYGHFDSTHMLIVSDSEIIALTGGDSIFYSSNGSYRCINASFSVVAPDSCGTDTRVFQFYILCNQKNPNTFRDTCYTISQSGFTTVSDNGNRDSLKISQMFYQNGIPESTINMCDSSFTIKYQISNLDSGSQSLPSDNVKHLERFLIFINPQWIDTAGLQVIYHPQGGGTSQTLSYADTSGFITVNLDYHTQLIGNDSSVYLELSGLRINTAGFNQCSPPNDSLITQARLAYLSSCGSEASVPPSPYWAVAPTGYGNFMRITSQGSATLNGENNDMVAPGMNPMLNFSWQQHPLSGNPWNFSPLNATGPSFFQCDTVTYQVEAHLPPGIALLNDTLYLRNGTGVAQHLLLTYNAISRLATASLPELGNSDSLSLQVTLDSLFCDTSHYGATVSPSINIIAICGSGTCSTRYCIKTISNTVSVHCAGICNATGIGTDDLVITNTEAPGVNSGYACDRIDFKVSGQGYSGAPAPAPDSTTSIYLVLIYPDSLGVHDSVFSLATATASASYTHLGVTNSVSISNASITRTQSGGEWEIKVPITDTAICKAIRANDDSFTIDLQMPIECNLGFDTANNGVYVLNGISALLEFDASGSIGYSCDNATGNFEVIAHQYGTSSRFAGAGICSQTLTITDSAVFGEPYNPEMPGFLRPLITWPTDGSFTISYPPGMSITGITYVDSSGNIYSAPIIDSTFTISNGTQRQTRVYGFLDSLSQFYWPPYSKQGPEFLRELIVQFSQSSCGKQVMFDTLPHQTSAQCATSCGSAISFTSRDTSNANSAKAWITEAVSGDSMLFLPSQINQAAQLLTYTIPYIVHTTGADSNVYIGAVNLQTPIPSPPVIIIAGTGDTLPVNNHSGVTQFIHITGDSIKLHVNIETCQNQTINLLVGYSCSGQPGMNGVNLCAIDSNARLGVNIYEPVKTNILLSDNQLHQFTNCKGICCSDSLYAVFTILNRTGGLYGPAYSPLFTLADAGPGFLDIDKIIFTHANPPTGHVIGTYTKVFPASSYNNVEQLNFSDTMFAPLGLPIDSFGRTYLPSQDEITAKVYVFGDGKNCAASAILSGFLNYTNICGDSAYVDSAIIAFTFNVNNCDTPVCTGASVCQAFDPWQSCSPCSYGAPMLLSGIVTNPGCGINDSSGKIVVHLTGGPPHGVNDLAAVTFMWNTGDTGTALNNLKAQTYTVIVNDLGCMDTATFTLSHSGFTVAAATSSPTCYGGGNGAIALTINGGVPPYSLNWAGPGSVSDSTGHGLTGIAAGMYIVTIADSSSLCAPYIDTIKITQPAAISVDFSNTAAGCGVLGSASVSAIANGTPNYHYRWSDSATTQTISQLNAGIYTVTVHDAKGCTVSANDTVINNGHITFPSHIVVTGNPCTDSSILLSVSIPSGMSATYLWSTYQSTDSIFVSLETGTQYTVTVTSGGCSSTDTINIKRLGISTSIQYGCSPELHINTFGITQTDPTGNPPFKIVLTVITNGVIETIDTATTYSPSYTYALPFQYANDTIHIRMQDSLGCTSTQYRVFQSDSLTGCCFTSATGHDTIYSHAYNDTAGNYIYFSPGTTFIVDNNFTFQNNLVILGSGAEIIVGANDTLNILGSSLHGCDTLWQGIIVYPNAQIMVDSFGGKRSSISDAITAIMGFSGSLSSYKPKMLIRRTDFYRNQCGIEFASHQLLDNSDYDVSNCYFGMGVYTSMLPAPSGKPNYKRPLYGILFGSLPGINFPNHTLLNIPNPHYSGQSNTFQYVNCGIYMPYGLYDQNKTLNVYTNVFDSITNYEGNTGFQYGAAVAANASIGGSGTLLVQTATSAVDTFASARFKHCDYGVKANVSNMTVQYCRMDSVKNGVYSTGCNHTVTVSNNYVSNTAYGISLINNSSASQLLDSNIIYVYPVVEHYGYIDTEWVYNPNAHDLFLDSVYGHIYAKTYGISEMAIAPSTTTIKNNTIYRGLNCIELNNTSNTKVGSNQLHLANDSAVQGNQAGMYAINCHNIIVSENTVDGDAAQYIGLPDTLSVVVTRYRKAGISFYNTHSGNVCSNVLGGTTSNTGLGYGMLYAGDCNAVDIYSNILNKSGYGLTLLTSATGGVIKTQGVLDTTYQNNDFAGTFSSSGNYATYSYIHSISYPRPIFYYLNGQGTTYHPAILNNGSTVINKEIIFQADSGTTELCELIHAIGPHGGNGEFAGIIAADSGKYYMVQGIDSLAANWLSEKTLYEALYGDTATLNNDSLMAGFYTRVDSSDRGAILTSELQNQLLTDSATLADTTSSGGKPSGYADALSRAQYLTDNIPIAHIQAANYKAMSKIYLQMITGVDTFTKGQIDTIGALALQCPYVAGDAVYLARALYAQIDNGTFFNDLTLCQITTGSERMLMVSRSTDTTTNVAAIPSEFVNLYPNPAKQVINLSYYAQTIGSVQFELIDQLGQPVIKQNLSSGQNLAQFAVGNLSNGLYYWQLMDSERIIKTGKVAIIK